MASSKLPAGVVVVRLVNIDGHDLSNEIVDIRKLLEQAYVQNEQIIKLLEQLTGTIRSDV